MKKTTYLLALFTFFACLTVNAQITTYPYVEDFEAGDGGWTADNTTSGTWALGAPAGAVINSAATGANAWVTNLTGDYNASESSTVTSPVFDLSALAAPSISFSIWWNSEFSWDGLVLQSSIDGGTTWVNVGALGDAGNWYTDDTISANPGGQQEGWSGRNSTGNGSGGWLVANHALTGLAGQAAVQLRFAFGSDDTIQDEGVAFDNINVFEVNCPSPTGVTATTMSDTAADITWNAGGTENDWQIWVQAAGTGVPTTDGVDTMSNNPYPATGLTPSTAYEVYVRSLCGGADGNSVWVGPINFSTFNSPPPAPVGVTCASGSSTTLFTESFGTDGNLDPVGWTGTGFNGLDGNWDITNPGANSDGTGPANTYDGNPGVHLEYEASGNSTDIASAISPAIDLSLAIDGAELAFWMHAFGDDFGTLNVNVGTSATGPFTNVYTWIGDLQTTDSEPWVPIGVNLDAYLGQVIYLEFSYGAAGTGWEGDMSIDQITVETCGNFCVAPSNIMAANITNTTADISWTGNNGETQWEYVIQPAGTGAPTGAGTMIGTPGFMAMGLSALTEYEVYVLADCGGSQSLWAGPFNFTTAVQLNFTVDCAVGPTNITYCYEDNDTNIFTFTSSDGSPLNFTVNAGTLESCCDNLIIFDTDGTELFNDNNGGDVSGVTFQSTGDTISYTVDSDGSINCQGGNFTPLDISVSCATCINPTATYQVVDDCANGDQFFVDVNITSLGDATSLSIEDNQGNTPVSVFNIGITQFGPYPFATDVIFTVSNEQDVNCVITSSAIQLAACPPENNNCDSATVAVVNDSFQCEVSTPGTLLEATTSGVPNPSCGGDPDDDVWFQFVATSEYQLIALANSDFNIDHVLYEGTCGSLTEIACTSGFGLLSSVTPQLTIGDTYFIRIFSNGSDAETSTFDLCITPYIAPENITCDATENLCPGGDDLYSYNTIGVEPGFGSIDCLGTSPNPTFSILEIGSNGDINIEMVQNTAFDATGAPIGDELDVDFALWGPYNAGDDYCNGGDYPSEAPVGCSYSPDPVENFVINGAVAGDLYIVLITNYEAEPGIIQINQTNINDPNAGTLSGELNVELVSPETTFVDDDSDPATPSISNLCGYPSITLDATSSSADVYEWSYNGTIDPALTDSTITVTESGTYSVTAYDTQCMGQDTETVVVNLFKDPIVNSVPTDEVTITTCDDESGDGIEDFDFSTLPNIILDSPGQNISDFLVTYHETLNEAQTGTNAITFPYSAVDGTTIYVRVEDVNSVGSGSGCASTNTTFNLVVLGALPEITGVQDLEMCDDDNDGMETFDLESQTPVILNGQDPSVFNVSYYASQADADAGTGALTSPYNNTSSPQPIYARIENTSASDCYKTTTFNLVIGTAPVTTFDNPIPYQVCPLTTVPITVTATGTNYSESEVTIQWFYEGDLIAGQTDLTLDTVLLAGDYEIEVMFNDTGCTASEPITITEYESCVIPQGISPNGDDLNETFDLTSYDVQSLKIFNRNGRLVYEKTGYRNEWHGQSLDGDELPVGTYYYIMNYRETETKAAWIYINREN